MSEKQKKFIIIIHWISIMAVVGFMIYQYFFKDDLNYYGIFTISLFLASLFELYTFGKTSFFGHQNHDEKGDELEEHIVKSSSKISYYTLLVIIFIIVIISEVNNQPNILLMLVFCASILTLPIIQFIVARKYK